jgi:hypothetical protein
MLQIRVHLRLSAVRLAQDINMWDFLRLVDTASNSVSEIRNPLTIQ